MKNILLLVHDDKGQEARVQGALDLARGLSGHIRCLDVTPIYVFPGDLEGAAAGQLVAAERVNETRNHAVLETRLANEALPWDWADALGDMANCLVGQARLADVIVVNCTREGWLNGDRRSIVTSVVTQANCPVVAIPDAAKGIALGGAALVCWDGSQPAANALRAAIPMLKLGGAVHVVTVGDIEDGPSAREAATYLSRHDIHAEVREIAGGAAEADACLLDLGQSLRADYCVMGAYGHGRMNEALFGGVTRRMIQAAQLPLVLAR